MLHAWLLPQPLTTLVAMAQGIRTDSEKASATTIDQTTDHHTDWATGKVTHLETNTDSAKAMGVS